MLRALESNLQSARTGRLSAWTMAWTMLVWLLYLHLSDSFGPLAYCLSATLQGTLQGTGITLSSGSPHGRRGLLNRTRIYNQGMDNSWRLTGPSLLVISRYFLVAFCVALRETRSGRCGWMTDRQPFIPGFAHIRRSSPTSSTGIGGAIFRV
jgi:hypothetical protein